VSTVTTILKIEDYRVYYRSLLGDIKAVDGVNLEISSGEIIGLIGESGSGKSTLALSIVNPKFPMYVAGGRLLLGDGLDLLRMSWDEKRQVLLKKISLIPQYALDALPVVKKIGDFVRDLARDKGVEEQELMSLFRERLSNVGLPDKVVDMYPIELSGGMRQRVIIALSTLFKPDLLIADEPTSALDTVTQRQVLELMTQLRDEGIVKSILFITHDIASVRQIADRIVVMYAGKIVEDVPTEVAVKEPLHPYTRLLIKSVPELSINYRVKRLTGLSGSPPSLRNPPPGCRFHPRCPFAMEVCREKEPPAVHIGEKHVVHCWLHVKR